MLSIQSNGIFWVDSPAHTGLVLAGAMTLAQVPCLVVLSFVNIKLFGTPPSDALQAAEMLQQIHEKDLKPNEEGGYTLQVQACPEALAPGLLLPLTTMRSAARLDWSLPDGY